MSLSLDFFTFLNAWVVSLFVVVPFFVRPSEKRTELEYAAAPQGLPWKKMFIANTLVSAVITGILLLVMQARLISLADFPA